MPPAAAFDPSKTYHLLCVMMHEGHNMATPTVRATAQTRHLDRPGQLGEFEQGSSTPTVCRYQRKRMYTRIALGKSSAMDVVGGESSGVRGQLLALLPGLFVLQAWQVFMGVRMVLVTIGAVTDPRGWLVRSRLSPRPCHTRPCHIGLATRSFPGSRRLKSSAPHFWLLSGTSSNGLSAAMVLSAHSKLQQRTNHPNSRRKVCFDRVQVFCFDRVQAQCRVGVPHCNHSTLEGIEAQHHSRLHSCSTSTPNAAVSCGATAETRRFWHHRCCVVC